MSMFLSGLATTHFQSRLTHILQYYLTSQFSWFLILSLRNSFVSLALVIHYSPSSSPRTYTSTNCCRYIQRRRNSEGNHGHDCRSRHAAGENVGTRQGNIHGRAESGHGITRLNSTPTGSESILIGERCFAIKHYGDE
jgi:hypothetical protein